MGEKERSRENVGRREEALKHKARQTEMMAREAEARCTPKPYALKVISILGNNTVIFVESLIQHRGRP
jgi:hypothetical protein